MSLREALSRGTRPARRAIYNRLSKIDGDALVRKDNALSRMILPLLRAYYVKYDLHYDRAVIREIEAAKFMPRVILVQISRRCNLTCKMCGWAVWQRNKGFMSFDLFRRVVREAKANGVHNIALTSAQGEALLSPHAAECIRLGIAEGLHVELNTNCTTLGNRNIDAICDAAASGRFKVQASFSGYDKQSHEAIYVGSKFEDTSLKLSKLNARLAECGLSRHLTVNGVILDGKDKNKHVDYLLSLGIDRERMRFGLPDNFAGIVQLGKRKGQKGFYSFKSNLPYRSLRLCDRLAYQMVVYDDGKVSACACRDSEGIMEIGDITRETLYEIRTGPRFRRMLDAFMARDIEGMPLCIKCDVPYGNHTGVPVA